MEIPLTYASVIECCLFPFSSLLVGLLYCTVCGFACHRTLCPSYPSATISHSRSCSITSFHNPTAHSPSRHIFSLTASLASPCTLARTHPHFPYLYNSSLQCCMYGTTSRLPVLTSVLDGLARHFVVWTLSRIHFSTLPATHLHQIHFRIFQFARWMWKPRDSRITGTPLRFALSPGRATSLP